MLPAIGLALFISRKGGLTSAYDNKNVSPEVEKTETVLAPEQSASDKTEPVVAEPAYSVRLIVSISFFIAR